MSKTNHTCDSLGLCQARTPRCENCAVGQALERLEQPDDGTWEPWSWVTDVVNATLGVALVCALLAGTALLFQVVMR